MNCPACQQTMFVMEYDGLELDHCSGCAGTWFDAGELALLFADDAGSPHPELVPALLRDLPAAVTRETPRRCPHCRKTMRKVRVTSGVNNAAGDGVLLDVCPRGDGLFCDAGEVGALARSLAADPEDLPARVIAYLGGALGRGDAATATEDT